jgi:hypothetical protein
MSFGKFHIYFLKSKPDVDDENFSDGLANAGVFSGLRITIDENVTRVTQKNGTMSRAHKITATFSDT